MPAESKAQRRMFSMALLHKSGKLPSKYVTEEIEELSELPESTLRKFAETKQKKRNKDGSISKRDAIPEYVKGSKYAKK